MRYTMVMIPHLAVTMVVAPGLVARVVEDLEVTLSPGTSCKNEFGGDSCMLLITSSPDLFLALYQYQVIARRVISLRSCIRSYMN